jgi:amino acid transporter
MIPISGGEYQYLLQAFGPSIAIIYSWTMIIFCNGMLTAAITLVFSDYVYQLISEGMDNTYTLKWIATMTIILITSMNCLHPHSGIYIQNIFTMIKLGVILLIIVIGSSWIITGQSTLENFHEPFQGTTTLLSHYSTAMYLALFSVSHYKYSYYWVMTHK